MSYQVLSRKWRPQQFSDMLGQAHVVRTLQNALERDRVAHAYIFAGPRGVGKTTAARILAKTLNCRQRQAAVPCNTCPSCTEITRGNNLDVLEIDAASNRGIDEIRELREAVKYPPTAGKYRIYIIDEVHMLTTQAFNALLKTLEEPPEHVVFILATTDPQKVPQTILSRTQRFDFRRVSVTDIAGLLGKILAQENIASTPTALQLLARKADGSIRDGLSLLDQVIAYQTEQVDEATVADILGLVDDDYFRDLAAAIARHDMKAVLAQIEITFDRGYDLQEIAQGFNLYLRDALLTLETSDPSLTSKGSLVEIPGDLQTADLLALLQIGMETENQMRYARQPRVLLEHQWLKMASLDRSVSIAELLGKLDPGPQGAPAQTTQPSVDEPRADAAAGAVAEPKPLRTGESESAQQMRPAPPGRSFRRQNGDRPGPGSTAESQAKSIGVDIKAVKKQWANILAAIESRSAATATILEGAEISSLEDDRLGIHLRAGEAIHLDMLMARKGLVEEIIEQQTGQRLSMVPTIPESAPTATGATAPPPADEAISYLIKTFNGEDY